MTDKVQKILNEIQRLINNHDSALDYETALEDVRNFINSLQEEPVSDDLEETAWLYYDKNRLPIPQEWDLHKEFIDFFKAGAQWQKSKDESSTEDLEEVSKKYSSCVYLEEVLSDDDKEVLKARLMNTFKAGANWQKEQMKKDAFECEVKIDAGGYPYIPQIELYDYEKDIPLAKAGDKVKVIIMTK